MSFPVLLPLLFIALPAHFFVPFPFLTFYLSFLVFHEQEFPQSLNHIVYLFIGQTGM